MIKQSTALPLSQLRWRQVIRGVFLIGVILIGVCWSIGWYFEVSTFQAGKFLVHAGVLKSLEMATAIYDPYISPLRTKFHPVDWDGWPLNSMSLSLLTRHLQAVTGENFRVQYSTVQLVDDRALDFAYESSMASELRELKDRYHLGEKIERSASQMKQLAILNNWTRSQWVHGSNRPVDFFRFNALDILEQAENGGQYWCQVASMVFAQVAAAVGYQARLLSLYSRVNGEPEHAVVEIWVDDLAKWVVFDTDFNLYYTNEFGVPLSALELHQALTTSNTNHVQVVKGSYRPEHFDVEGADAQPLLLSYYRYFCVEMRNDWLSNSYFLGHKKRSDKATLCWQGKNRIRLLDLKPIAQYESDLYWPINSIEIRLTVDAVGSDYVNVTAYLKTLTPNFDHFEVKVQNSKELKSSSALLKWKLMPGRNLLEVRAVNALGVKGPLVSFMITWSKKVFKTES